MKRAQKKFECDRRKKNFHASETLRGAKARNCEQSSQFNNKKKNRAKKKKSGNLMKRAQKNFESDPRQKKFLRAKPYGLVKARNCELQSSQFNKNTMPPVEVIANHELCRT